MYYEHEQVFGLFYNSQSRPFLCFLLARLFPINKNQRATVLHFSTSFVHHYPVYLWKCQKNFKDMNASAATVDCQTRIIKMLNDLYGAFCVDIAVHNH